MSAEHECRSGYCAMETESLRLPGEGLFPEELLPGEELLLLDSKDELFPILTDLQFLDMEQTDQVSATASNFPMDIADNDFNLESNVIAFNSIYSNEENTGTDASFATIGNTELSYEGKISRKDDPCAIRWMDQFDNLLQTMFTIERGTNVDIFDINLPQEIINPPSQLKLKEEEQKTDDIKEEDTSQIIDDTKTNDTKTEIKQERKEEEVNYPITSSVLSQKTRKRTNESAKTKSQNAKEKRKKIEDSVINTKIKPEEQEDCVDVVTIPDEVPVLEAVDVKSLLEQFEASENPNPRNKSTVKNNRICGTKSNKMWQGVIQECGASISEKSVMQASNQQKDIRTSLPKEVIDRIKASGRKKPISIIPAMPNIQNGNRSNSVRMQEKTTFSHNKVLKRSTITNNAKSRTFNHALVQLDHDYCSNVSLRNMQSKSNSNSNKFTKQTSKLKSNQNKNSGKIEECRNNANTKKHCNSELASICSTSGKPAAFALQNKQTDKIKDNLLENDHKDCKKGTPLKQSHDSSDSLSVKNINVSNNKTSPVHEMKIRSALAESILQSRNGMPPKTNIAQTNSKRQQMISVLKNPPNASQSPFSRNNSNENIMTTQLQTTNSLNNEVQNIIIQNTQDTVLQKEMKNPPRRKLNLAEYRSRREQNRNDNSKTNSPMVLVYVHHVSTTTTPIKDNPENPIWSEREIIPVLKLRSDIQKEENKLKPSTCDIGIQTYETVFEFAGEKSLVNIVEKDEEREESIKNRKQKSCRRHRLSRNSSRSRSKSKSRSGSRCRIRGRRRSRSKSRSKSRSQSRSRTRSRNANRNRSRNRSRSINTRSRSRSRNRSRNRSRSTSHRRVNTRRRTISHRRSSVSSTSSWSSRSSISRSRYSDQSSRSSLRSRMRSRSRSSTRYYSSSSRSSSRSTFGRNKWSNNRRRNSSDRERSYDRYRGFTFNNRRDYRHSRSPLRSYRKPYDDWHNREKQKQVEERRVIYVGCLDDTITKADLRRRFETFGPVIDISIHLREHGDNYGFVTFSYKEDANNAVEHGNDDSSLPRYDLSFGGRRAFCKSKYADLDNMGSNTSLSRLPRPDEENSFDFLLKEAKAKLRQRKV